MDEVVNSAFGSAFGRRRFLQLATVAAGAVLSGCRYNDDVPGARVTLRQWYHQYGEDGTHEAVMRYAREYTKAHPDIAVKVVWVPGDYNTKINTALLTSGGPDVFEKNSLTIPMVSAEQVEPLDDLFTPEIRQDFLPDDVKSYTVDGKIYGVKMVNDTGLIYYRKSLFKQAGLPVPRTLDELMQSALALTNDKRKGLYLGNDEGVGALINLIPWSAGAQFLQNDQLLFDTPRTVAAYEKLAQLTASKALLRGAPTDWWDPSAFNQDQCAMQWGGLWSFPAIHEKWGDDVGAIPWPALDAQGTPVTFAGGWAQMVNSRSRNVEEAKKYVNWLWIENAAIQKDWNLKYGFHVPPRLSIARNAQALQAEVPQVALKSIVEYGRALPPAWSGSMTTALNDAVSNIVKNRREVAPEIKTAAFKCERELKRQLRYRT